MQATPFARTCLTSLKAVYPGCVFQQKSIEGVTSDEELIFINRHVLFLFVCSRGLDYSYVAVGPLVGGDVPQRDGSGRSRAIALGYALDRPDELEKLPREDRARIKSTLLRTKTRIRELVEDGRLAPWEWLKQRVVDDLRSRYEDSPTPWRAECSFYV